MITIYKEELKKLKLIFKEDNDSDFSCTEDSWIDITFPNEKLLKEVAKQTGLDLNFLLVSLDPEETARTDREDNSLLKISNTKKEIILMDLRPYLL